MKIRLSLLAPLACLAFSLTAHASDIAYNISSGTFSPSGSFSGSFLINSSTEIIDGGSISATAPGGGTTYTFFAAGSDSTTGGFESFSDTGGDVFRLALDGSLATLAVNTLAGFGSGDTALILATGSRFDATGATVSVA